MDLLSVRLHVYAICICLTLSVCTYVYCTGNIFWSPFLNFYMNLEFKLCCKYCMYIVHVQYKVLSCCFCLKYDKSIALFYTEGVHSYLAICLSACVTMNYLSIYLTVKSLFKPIYFMQDWYRVLIHISFYRTAKKISRLKKGGESRKKKYFPIQ